MLAFCGCVKILVFLGMMKFKLCKAISVQRNDTYPTVVRETSRAIKSCKRMHSVHSVYLTEVGDLRTMTVILFKVIESIAVYI